MTKNDLSFPVKRSVASFCQGRDGISWGVRGCLGLEGLEGTQMGQVAMALCICVAMPGQKRISRALCFVFSMPGWLECIFWIISGRRDAGTRIFSPLNMMPSRVDS